VRHLAFCAARGQASRVRLASFEERSWLPLSAACLVAGGIRETLAALLGVPLHAQLFEPGVPDPDGWNAIVRDAIMYRRRGSVSDAAIVLRSGDAVAIAAAAFGERGTASTGSRALSALERDVLERTVAAIARTLVPVCGPSERETVECVSSIAGYRTYFEIAVAPPVDARIGIAVSHDPPPQPVGNLTIDALSDVVVEADVLLDVAHVPMGSIAALRCGDMLAVRPRGRTRLSVAGRTIGTGSSGIRNGRYALSIGAGE
jgi:hypothetical protein